MRFRAKYLYTLDTPDPIVNGWVECADDGTITSVGDSSDAASGETYVDGAIVPGFVNAHCHIELSYMWKLFKKNTGMAGFIDQINALRDTKPYEEKIADIARWMDLLWKRGVSAMADISNCHDSFPIKASSPIYTRTFLEVFGTEPSECDAVISSVRALQQEAERYGLDAAPTPHACYTMSPELLTASSAEALRSGYLSYHSEETPEEEEMMISGTGAMTDNRKRYSMSMPPVTGKSSLLYFIDRLEKVHPAPFVEHILLVHEVCMTGEGADIVKEKMNHPFIALCPRSNIFIHNALPPVRLMRSKGLALTVGTDSLSSNDDLDMVGELFCLQENFPDIPLGETLTWACRTGAEFLSKENALGRIAPGMKPGLVSISHISPSGELTSASQSQRLV